jgi:hypothetical protein
MVVFIKLGQKHASKGEVELAVFEVLREFLSAVWVLGLLCKERGSELLLGFFLVHSVSYGIHKQAYIK